MRISLIQEKAAVDLHDLIAIANESLTTAKQGVKLNEGARIVLAGSPKRW